MGRMQDKVTVVTGAGRGIGAVMAKAFAAEGARVVVTDVRDTSPTVDAINAAGGQALGLHMDVTSDADIANMVQRTEASFGPIECLMNNAGVFASVALKPFWEIPTDEWDMMMRVNVRGSWQVAKGVLPSMRKCSRGKIVNVSSGTLFHGGQGLMHYVASKGAVIGMTRAMARELGNDNITVNCLVPGYTDSDGTRENTSMQIARAPTLANRVFKRDEVPEDMVGAVIFMLTPDSDFMTGQMMNVDGGRYMI